MNSAGFVDKMDDLLNPIVVKELRQAVKSRIVIAALFLFLLTELVILLLSLSLDENRRMDPTNLHAGRPIFQVLQGILLGTCMLLIPAYAGIRLAAEHSDTNVDLLFISTLRPRGIIAGKLLASIVLILLIFSAGAPFMTFTYLLRGIDVPSILLLLVLDFLVVLLAAQGAIFLGAVPANPGLKLLLGLLGLGLLLALFISTMIFSDQMLDLGVGSRLDSIDFWIVAGAVAIVLLASVGLFFTWSVAIVSPPSANRALPVRLYLLGFWLATGGIAVLLTRHFRTTAALYIWERSIMALLCAQIVVSINEREQWGLRVRRTIPRREWLRGPAFLTYSGAAGGVLLALLLIALTLAFLSVPLPYWTDSSPLLPGGLETDPRSLTTFTLLLIALYTFDYCLTAVWLRNTLFAGWIKATYTWVLAMVLWGLGSALPFPLLFLLNNQEWRLGHVNPWWQISNPFSTILTCRERDMGAVLFRMKCLPFLIGWGVIVLLGCLPWMIRQMRRFRPPEKGPLAV
jgi:hypothetical protein